MIYEEIAGCVTGRALKPFDPRQVTVSAKNIRTAEDAQHIEFTLTNFSHFLISGAKVSGVARFHEWSLRLPNDYRHIVARFENIRPGEQVTSAHVASRCPWISHKKLIGIEITLAEGTVFGRSLTIGGLFQQIQCDMIARLPGIVVIRPSSKCNSKMGSAHPTRECV